MWENSRGDRIADIGCAYRPHVHMGISRANPGSLVVGIDIREDVLRSARIPNGLVADGLRLPIQSHSMDAVVLSEIIEHVEDQKRLLSEAGRVLVDGGSLVLTTPNLYSLTRVLRWAFRGEVREPKEHKRLLDPHSLRRMLEETGFKLVDLETRIIRIPIGQGIIINFQLPLMGNLGHNLCILAEKKLED